MDIPSYFSPSSAPTVSSDSGRIQVVKAYAITLLRDVVLTKNYPAKIQKWEKDFPWRKYDENYRGVFCKDVESQRAGAKPHLVVYGSQSQFRTGKR